LAVAALTAPPEARRDDPFGQVTGAIIIASGGLLVAFMLLAWAWPVMMQRCFLGLGGGCP
jgi:hypothetical protein